jgi:hypothetical protein
MGSLIFKSVSHMFLEGKKMLETEVLMLKKEGSTF